MAKRTAQKQLTMDNFEQEDDDEYDPDEAGPQLASEEVLKARPMAKARRRSDLNASGAEEPKRTAFAGFGGFKGFATNTTQNPSFNAFKAITQMETNDATKTSSSSTLTNGGKPVVSQKTEPAVEDMTTEDSEDIYNNKLSELNKCFFQHISGYMSRSEFFDFTQVCKEYIEFHKKIETESKAEAVATTSGALKISALPSSSFIPSPSSLPSTYSTSSASYQSSHSVFGSQMTTSSRSSQSPISSQTSGLFSSQASANEEKSSVFAKPTIQFGLTANKPLSAGFTTTTSETTSKATTEENTTEESDEPPKVESVEHKEPDSVFSVKCKLFFKKGEDWSSKGVGYLYIKKGAAEGSPAQLLIRADNKLGNILLHISLNDSLPISKAPQNKGLYLACAPNPPLDPKATTQTTVTFLIRVKAEDTEQLFDTLVKYKTNQ